MPPSNAVPDDAVDLGVAGTEAMTVRLERHGSAVVLVVSGEIDLITAHQLEEAFTLALRDRPAVMIVDLTEVAFLASAGMNVLLSSRTAAADTRFRLVATGSTTLRPMELIGVTEKIAVFSSRAQALAAD